MKKLLKIFAITVISALMVICAVFSAGAADESGNWIAVWGTGPTDISLMGYNNVTPIIGSATARTVITPTASGSKIRIRFSNYYGESPLTINAVTVAKSKTTSTNPDDASSEIYPETTKVVTFNDGQPYVTIPAGAEYYSDPINFEVTAMENIAISYYAANVSEIRTMGLSGGTTFLTFGENKTTDTSFGIAQEIDPQIMDIINSLLPFKLELKLTYKIVRVIPCLASVDVLSSPNAYSVAVVGDSTVSNQFPMYLGEQINALGANDVGVMCKGIIGNMLLHDGLGYAGLVFGESLLTRFQRDVLSQSGIKYVVLKIGANDIIHPVCVDNQQLYPDLKQPTAQDIIEGYKQLINACHNAGKKVIVCSITQWKGNTRDYFGTGDKYVRTEEEFEKDWQIALDVNKWLASSTMHDGFVDLTTISANPIDPAAFFPEYTEDGCHPKDNLQQIWAQTFPLGLLGVSQRVGYVRLDTTTATVNVGKTVTLKPTVLPSNAADKTVKWSSSNTAVATVDANGKVTAVKNGTATITCTTNDGGYKATCVITVVTPVSGVTLSQTTASVYNTKSITLSAVVSPSTATNKAVTWSSSNTKIATVTSAGKVTGVGSGTVYITCTTKDGGFTARCKVTVLKKTEVTSITLNHTSKGVYRGYTYRLTATVGPSNATFKDVTWSSTNTKVATVDSTGLVKGVAKGSAYIVCTSSDNKAVYARCKVNVVVKTTGVKLNYSKLSVYETASKTLTATISPSDATYKTLTWTSSNKAVATVDSNGVVKGIKPGTATITCKTNNGGYTATCAVTVKSIVRTTGVAFSRSSYTVNDGEKIRLTPVYSPSNATLKTCEWSSSDKSIAIVSQYGTVKGIKPGKVTITCKTKDTGKTASCVVTVKTVVPTSVKLSKTKVSLDPGKTSTLTATVSPTNASSKKVTWKSSNTAVAKVSSSGKITAVKPGKATITCTTSSGGKTATCTVTVNTIKISSIKLSRTSLTLNSGKYYTLKATISPSNATSKKVVWKSSNTKVVTVDSNGKLTAVGAGKAYVTCKPGDGGSGKGAICTVEVKTVPVLGVTLNSTSVSIKLGSTYTLKATVVPSNATNKSVKWTSTNSAIASVNSSGKITAKKRGSCIIKVSTADGNFIAQCRVLVT